MSSAATNVRMPTNEFILVKRLGIYTQERKNIRKNTVAKRETLNLLSKNTNWKNTTTCQQISLTKSLAAFKTV
jgi:hypothetical protein